jgi:hypothetical protein
MKKFNIQINFVGCSKNSMRGTYHDLQHGMLADSVEEVKAEIEKTYIVVKWGKVQQEPVKPRMTEEEYLKEQEEILAGIPQEFKGPLSYMAYERGHSAGNEESIGILRGLVSDLREPIKAFEKRLAKPHIVVSHIGGEFKAEIQGQSGKWGTGKTSYEAVGDLVLHHPGDFGDSNNLTGYSKFPSSGKSLNTP